MLMFPFFDCFIIKFWYTNINKNVVGLPLFFSLPTFLPLGQIVPVCRRLYYWFERDMTNLSLDKNYYHSTNMKNIPDLKQKSPNTFMCIKKYIFSTHFNTNKVYGNVIEKKTFCKCVVKYVGIISS